MAEVTYQYGDSQIARGLLDIAKVDFNAIARQRVHNVEVQRYEQDGSARFAVTIHTDRLPREVVEQILTRAAL